MGLAVLFRASGTPIPEGHVRAFARKGGGIQYAHGSPGLALWRSQVAMAAFLGREGEAPYDGPVYVAMTFHMARPKSHLDAAGNVKASAPEWPAVRPDVDKLARAVLDAISLPGKFHGPPILSDDSRVVAMEARKVYALPSEWPGVSVAVFDMGHAVVSSLSVTPTPGHVLAGA